MSAGHQRVCWVVCLIPIVRSNQGQDSRRSPFSQLSALCFFFLWSHVFHFSSVLHSQLSNIFDVEYVTCQLRHSGILEAIHITKEGYPVRLPFQNFLARYNDILAWDSQATQSLDELVSTLWFILLWGFQLQPWLSSYQCLFFQVWPPGWARARLLGEERSLCGSAVSCGGEPLRSLSDWSNKGGAYRGSHLNSTGPATYSWAVSGHWAARLSCPKKGNIACLHLPFALSCLKYGGKILAFQIKNRRQASGCFSSMTTSFILPAFLGGGLGCCFSCLVTFITLQFPAPEPSSANTSTSVMWAYTSCPLQLRECSFLSREPYGQ